MKKIISILMAMALALSVCGMLFSCGKEPNPAPGDPGQTEHTHVFDQKSTIDTYLASAATQDAPATYYFSCTCGEKGTETFENGNKLPSAIQNILDTINATVVEEITVKITTTTAGATLKATTKMTGTTNSVEYEVLNKLDINTIPGEMTTKETVDAKSGVNTIVISALSFADENFTESSYEDGVLTATVSNPSAFFGTEITTFTTAEITISIENNYFVEMTVSYTTTSGSEVTLVATFN